MNNLWNILFSPMLLKEVDKPFNSKDYLYELKFDGIRALIYASIDDIKIVSRNKQDLTYLFPELKSISKSVSKKVIFDGEIIVDNNFSMIQKRLHLKNKTKIDEMSKEAPVTYIVFDVLYENKNLVNKTLMERKKYLDKYKDTEYFVKSKIYNDGIKLFREVKKNNLEGIVAKNKKGLYHINKRTDDFIKIKNIQRDEYLIGGYKINKNYTITILLAVEYYKKYQYVGSCVLSHKSKLYDILLSENKTKNYFNEDIKDAIFIKPKYKCFINYLEKTKNGHLRHASFGGSNE